MAETRSARVYVRDLKERTRRVFEHFPEYSKALDDSDYQSIILLLKGLLVVELSAALQHEIAEDLSKKAPDRWSVDTKSFVNRTYTQAILAEWEEFIELCLNVTDEYKAQREQYLQQASSSGTGAVE